MTDPDVASSADPAKARSAARLLAAQALYQLEIGGGTPARVLAEFNLHRLGETIDGESMVLPDGDLFHDLVDGAWQQRADLDAVIGRHLAAGWSVERLDKLLLQLLRVAAYELRARMDIPARASLSEYVDVARAFYGTREPAFVNGVLDAIARTLGRL